MLNVDIGKLQASQQTLRALPLLTNFAAKKGNDIQGWRSLLVF
jgi:hypothetical protein